MKNSTTDYLNIGMMLAATVLAFYLPFDLLLVSYTVLGPAHYLTEISWLHKKKYFATDKKETVVLACSGMLAVGLYRTLVFPAMVCCCFCIPFVFRIIRRAWTKVLAISTCLALSLPVTLLHGFSLLFGLYLPTLVHVYIFTGAFMLLGALKQKSRTGYVAVAVFVLCPLALLVFPSTEPIISNWGRKNYMLSFAPINGSLLKNLDTETIFTNRWSITTTRCFAFAYTYHYLNWFSKVKIIRWHDLPKKRLATISIVWILSVGLYAYDFSIGLQLLFVLSFLHVVLEFPLNVQTLGLIKKQLKR